MLHGGCLQHLRRGDRKCAGDPQALPFLLYLQFSNLCIVDKLDTFPDEL